MTTKLSTVLVGTSLELSSDAVVRTGVELARRAGAALHLFHAHALPLAYFAAPSGFTTVDSDFLEAERQVREQLLEQQLLRLGVQRSEVDGVTIEAGSVHRMLLETASELDADLLVVGARESERATQLGSTTDRILRKTTCPVWVVDGRPRLPPERVLAPVDLSELSEDCLVQGVELLDRLGAETAALEALFVLTPEELEGSHQFTPEQLRHLASDELATLRERTGLGDRLATTVREGEIRNEIVHQLREEPIDLVVLGTHGRSGFERFLLGSVAADVAARAGVSVLVVPPTAARAGHEETESSEEAP
ncbi:MAG: universal stress protein [Acidobacteriota bacterium]